MFGFGTVRDNRKKESYKPRTSVGKRAGYSKSNAPLYGPLRVYIEEDCETKDMCAMASSH